MIVVGMLVIAVLVAVDSVRDEIEGMREQIEELSKTKDCPLSEAGDASQVQWEPIGKAGGKQ